MVYIPRRRTSTDLRMLQYQSGIPTTMWQSIGATLDTDMAGFRPVDMGPDILVDGKPIDKKGLAERSGELASERQGKLDRLLRERGEEGLEAFSPDRIRQAQRGLSDPDISLPDPSIAADTRPGSTREQLATRDVERRGAQSAFMSPEEFNKRNEDLGLTSDKPMTKEEERLLREGKIKEQIELITRDLAGESMATLPLHLIAGIGAIAQDPLELAGMFIPFTSTATRLRLAGTYGARSAYAAVGAGEAAAGAALMEVPYYTFSQAQQRDWDYTNSLLNVAAGGLLGTGIGYGRGIYVGRGLKKERLAAEVREFEQALARGDEAAVEALREKRLSLAERKGLGFRVGLAQAAAGEEINLRGILSEEEMFDTANMRDIEAFAADLRKQLEGAGIDGNAAAAYAELHRSQLFSILQRHDVNLRTVREVMGEMTVEAHNTRSYVSEYLSRSAIVLKGKNLRDLSPDEAQRVIREATDEEINRALAEQADKQSGTVRSIRQAIAGLRDAADSLASQEYRRRLRAGEAVTLREDDGEIRIERRNLRDYDVKRGDETISTHRSQRAAIESALANEPVTVRQRNDVALQVFTALRSTNALSADEAMALIDALRALSDADLRRLIESSLGIKVKDAADAFAKAELALRRIQSQAPGATPGPPELRGFAMQDSGRYIIGFLNRDESTFLHESAHYFLELYGRLAAKVDAPDSIKAEMQTILNWLGAKRWEDVTPEMHERWAEGFEEFLRTGNAPSDILKNAFRMFRQWLQSIYDYAVDRKLPISDDVRGAMERMIAPEEMRDVRKFLKRQNGPEADAADVARAKAAFENSEQAAKSAKAPEGLNLGEIDPEVAEMVKRAETQVAKIEGDLAVREAAGTLNAIEREGLDAMRQAAEVGRVFVDGVRDAHQRAISGETRAAIEAALIMRGVDAEDAAFVARRLTGASDYQARSTSDVPRDDLMADLEAADRAEAAGERAPRGDTGRQFRAAMSEIRDELSDALTQAAAFQRAIEDLPPNVRDALDEIGENITPDDVRALIVTDDISEADAEAAIRALFGDEPRSYFQTAGEPRQPLEGFESTLTRALRDVERGAKDIEKPSGTAAEWRKELEARGAKPKEFAALGWDAAFEGRNGKLSRSEVVQFIEQNQPELEVKVLGGSSSYSKESDVRLPGGSRELTFNDRGNRKTFRIKQAADGSYDIFTVVSGSEGRLHTGVSSEAQAEHIIGGTIGSADGAKTRFGPGSSTPAAIPGGEPGTYREVLIRDTSLGIDGLKRRFEEAAEAAKIRIGERRDPNVQRALDERREAARQAYNEAKSKERPPYTSKHFHDQEVAHLRVDDRQVEGVGRTLFVQELQSDIWQDWGNVSRLLGMSMDEMRAAGKDDLLKRLDALRHAEMDRTDDMTEMRKRINRMHAHVQQYGTPPKAALSDNWMEVGVKQALRMAAREGYDAVAFSRSDQIGPVVGNTETLGKFYDEIIPRYLKKYVKGLGGEVESVPALAEVGSALDETARLTAFAAERFGVDPENVTTRMEAEVFREFKAADAPAEPPTNPLIRVTPEMRETLGSRPQALYQTAREGNGDFKLNVSRRGGSGGMQLELRDGERVVASAQVDPVPGTGNGYRMDASISPAIRGGVVSARLFDLIDDALTARGLRLLPSEADQMTVPGFLHWYRKDPGLVAFDPRTAALAEFELGRTDPANRVTLVALDADGRPVAGFDNGRVAMWRLLEKDERGKNVRFEDVDPNDYRGRTPSYQEVVGGEGLPDSTPFNVVAAKIARDASEALAAENPISPDARLADLAGDDAELKFGSDEPIDIILMNLAERLDTEIESAALRDIAAIARAEGSTLGDLRRAVREDLGEEGGDALLAALGDSSYTSIRSSAGDYPLDASRGAIEPSRETLFQTAAKTDTPEFKKFFGNSKATADFFDDAAGSGPADLFHGSPERFSAFKEGERPIFLSPVETFAEQFVDGSPRGKVFKLYASVQKPFVLGGPELPTRKMRDAAAETQRDIAARLGIQDRLDDLGLEGRALIAEFQAKESTRQGAELSAAEAFAGRHPDLMKRVSDLLGDDVQASRQRKFLLNVVAPEFGVMTRWSELGYFTKALRRLGFDGFVEVENGRHNLAVFKNTQVKDTKNRGTWDGSDPRMLYQTQTEGSPRYTMSEAAEGLVERAMTQTAINRRNAAINARIRQTLLDGAQEAFDRHGDPSLAAEKAVGPILKRLDAIRSADTLGNAYGNAWRGFLISSLGEKKLMERFRSGAHDENIAVELEILQSRGKPKVEPTGDEFAAKIAKEIHAAQEMARAEVNQVGGWRRPLENFISSTSHDPARMIRRGPDEWKSDMMGWLDWDRIDPELDPGQTRDDFLQSAFDATSTGIRFGAPKADDIKEAFTGPRNIARSASEHRKLHFKDGKSWYAYNQKYGTRGLFDTVMSGLDYDARSVGLMEMWGTNPEAMLRVHLEDVAKKFGRQSPVVQAMFGEGGKPRRRLQNLMSDLTGDANRVGNMSWATIGANVRALTHTTTLGGATLSAITDTGYAATAWLRVARNPLAAIVRGFVAPFEGIAMRNGWGSQQQRQFAEIMGLGVSGDIGMGSTRVENAADFTRFSQKGVEKFFKWSFLTQWTDAVRMRVGSMWLREVGMYAAGEMTAPTEGFKRMMQDHGVKLDDLALIKEYGLRQVEGKMFADPHMLFRAASRAADAVAAIDPTRRIKIGESVSARTSEGEFKIERRAKNAYAITRDGQEISTHKTKKAALAEFSALRPVREAASEQLASDLRRVGQGVLMTAHEMAETASPQPGVRERAFTHQGQARGTFTREGLAFMWQFKSFGLTAMRKFLYPIFTKYDGAMDRSNAVNVAAMIAITWPMGVMAMWLKEIMRGKEPTEVWSEDDGLAVMPVLAGLMQSGGLGLYGDFLIGRYSRTGNTPLENAAGPVLGAAASGLGIWQRFVNEAATDELDNSILSQIIDFGRYNLLPGNNLFYAKPFLDYLIMFHLQEAANPGYLKRIEDRMKRDQNKKYLKGEIAGMKYSARPRDYIKRGGGFK